MKAFKRLSLTLPALLLVFSVLCVGVSAQGEKNDIVQNDKIYTVLPEGYFVVGGFNGLTYFDEEYNTISFIVTENKIAPEGIQKADFNEVKGSFITEYLCDEMTEESDIVMNIASTDNQTVNGLRGVIFRGNYSVKTGDENELWEFVTFAFATKEDVFFVTYEQLTGELNKSDFDYTLNGLTVNGTFFDGDRPTVIYNFENAISFSEAVENADEGLYSEIDEEVFKVAAVFIYGFALIPILGIIVVIIVVAVKYSKNKKQLRKYESRFGQINAGYANPYPPINNGYSPYGQGYNPQSGYSPYTNQYTQPPVQSVQTPAEPAQAVQETPIIAEQTAEEENK